jgi:hypothetical protein
VDDLAATRDQLATRGVDSDEIQPVNKGVELSAATDPDGNNHVDRQLPREVLAPGSNEFAIMVALAAGGVPRLQPPSG